MLSSASNPNIAEGEINTPIYTAYGRLEVIAELRKLIAYIRLLDYDPWPDPVLNYYSQILT